MDDKKITPCLWFNKEAEEAAKFYVSIFRDARIININYYPKEGQEVHGQKEGSVMTVDFILNGQPFLALNGGPAFTFTEAISLTIPCQTQEEVDHYWSKLTEGGEESMCGWLKDKYGLSWQVVPTILPKLLMDPAKKDSVMKAFMQMRKFDIEKLKNA